MNKHQNLLLRIANSHQIRKGKNESEEEWKVRIIYSVCGLMAYTSLWDELSEEPISITHIKHRIRSIYNSYVELYPEISSFFPYEKEELENEIVDVFSRSGMMYHKPNRLSPTKEISAYFNNVIFRRGISIDKIHNISGIGFYDYDLDGISSTTIEEMFRLNELSLSDYWTGIVKQAKWIVSDEYKSDAEYLKMEFPYSKGYWTNKPYKTGRISIFRTGMKGSRLYYLYRYIDNVFEISPLPNWQVENQHYRTISCACLHVYNALPSIDYDIDGELVHLHMNYLLPPQELLWVKLYSWPEKCNVLPNDFYRKCSLDVFKAFIGILAEKGYTFNER